MSGRTGTLLFVLGANRNVRGCSNVDRACNWRSGHSEVRKVAAIHRDGSPFGDLDVAAYSLKDSIAGFNDHSDGAHFYGLAHGANRQNRRDHSAVTGAESDCPGRGLESGLRYLQVVAPSGYAWQSKLARGICRHGSFLSSGGLANGDAGSRNRCARGVSDGSCYFRETVERTAIVFDSESNCVRLWAVEHCAPMNLNISRDIIGGIEAVIGACTAHYVVRLVAIPLHRFEAKLSSPRVAKVCLAGLREPGEYLRQIAFFWVITVGETQAFRQLVYLIHETGLIASSILGVFRHRHRPAELSFEFVCAHQFRGGKQGTRGPVALFDFRLLHRFDDLRHADGVNFIARLHHFLLEVEEDFGKAGLLLGQREDGLIHDLQARERRSRLRRESWSRESGCGLHRRVCTQARRRRCRS